MTQNIVLGGVFGDINDVAKWVFVLELLRDAGREAAATTTTTTPDGAQGDATNHLLNVVR